MCVIIELDEQIVHHMMGLPATIVIESIRCGNLTIKVPWRHLKSEPLSVKLEEVVVQMTELPTAGPPDRTIPKLDRVIQMLFVFFVIFLLVCICIIDVKK